MPDRQELLVPALWIAWGLYWWIASRGVKRVVRRESLASRALHLGPLAIATALLAAPFVPGWLGERWASATQNVYVVGLALVAAGLLFTVWARIALGGNWSGTVTLKQDHEIIRSGPYRWIRHPIYTGLLLACLGSAIALGEWRGLLALWIAAAAFWRKLRIEEQWLDELFGSAYADYRQSTWALVPFLF
jgi:protein-S-isoprenylcysteine O-methyltransferase Ste14